MTNYKVEAISELAVQIKQAGYRVFIAARGEYGFYTDACGSRVVCFQYDLGGINFSGNYKTEQPRTTGTGWRLEVAGFTDMFNQVAPEWAVGRFKWTYTTLAQHLATFQASSKYVEL